MRKKMFNQGFILLVVGIFAGAFYREFTKFMNFSGETSLSLIHTHLIETGALVAFIFCAILKSYNIRETKKLNTAWTLYLVGVVGNVATMFIRGVYTVLNIEVNKAVSASISGVAGIQHILLTVGIIWFLNIIRKEIV